MNEPCKLLDLYDMERRMLKHAKDLICKMKGMKIYGI